MGNDSRIFVNYPGNNNNNRLEIIGNTGVTTVDGSVISVARNNRAVDIRNGGASKANVNVIGLVYARGTGLTGGCHVEDATVSGSIVCNQFDGNRIRNVAITYNASSLPATPPDGFDGFISVQANSWEGL